MELFGKLCRMYLKFVRFRYIKAELLQVDILFLIHLFAGEILLLKMLEIEETKTTQYTTFKTDILKVVLVFSISNFFTNKYSQGRKLSAANH